MESNMGRSFAIDMFVHTQRQRLYFTNCRRFHKRRRHDNIGRRGSDEVQSGATAADGSAARSHLPATANGAAAGTSEDEVDDAASVRAADLF